MTDPTPLIELPKEMFQISLCQKVDQPKIHLEIRRIGLQESTRVPVTPEIISLMDGKSSRWVIGSLDDRTKKFQIWEIKK